MKKDSIAAVALTTQRSTVVNVDEKGEPLRPAIDLAGPAAARTISSPVGGFWGAALQLPGRT